MLESISSIKARRDISKASATATYHRDMICYHTQMRNRTAGLTKLGHSAATLYHNFLYLTASGEVELRRNLS